jgi:hypothetical protein
VVAAIAGATMNTARNRIAVTRKDFLQFVDIVSSTLFFNDFVN